MEESRVLGVNPLMVAPLAFIIWVISLWFLKSLILRLVRGLAQRTRTGMDDLLLSALNLPLTMLILGSGFILLTRVLPLSETGEKVLIHAFRVSLLLAIVVFLDRLLRGFIRRYAERMEVLRNAENIVAGFARVLILSVGIFVILDNLGISLTPLIAGLGVGSLAVALALQDTLANFFAGVQLVADKPIEVGQYIGLESGEQGFVTRVGWRTTQIRMIPNNIVAMPNSKLLNSRITNFSLPVPEMSLRIPVGVDYRSDLEHVERVTVEVARQVQQTVKGAKPDFEPFVRYHEFADFSINLRAVLRIEDFVAQYNITHEFIKRLHRRYRDEGIVIPFPIRTVEMSRPRPGGEKDGRSQAPADVPPPTAGGGEEQEIA